MRVRVLLRVIVVCVADHSVVCLVCLCGWLVAVFVCWLVAQVVAQLVVGLCLCVVVRVWHW